MTKKKMNSIQENYIIAKAFLEAVKAVQREKYESFINEKNIDIDSITDDEFSEMNLCYETYAKKEIGDTKEAYELFIIAEKALLGMGMDLLPKKYRSAMVNGVLTNAFKKMQAIECLLKLDARYMPAKYRRQA